jgi:hypothetical protein
MTMELWRHIRSSIYDPEFYRGLPYKPASLSWKYFFSVVVVLDLIITAILAVFLIPPATSFLHNLGPKLLDAYPADLIITIRDHRAASNVQGPVAIRLPAGIGFERSEGQAPPPANLLVIDTQQPATLDGFTGYDTLALLTANAVIYRDSQGIKVQPLDQIPDFQLTKQLLASYVGKFDPFVKFVGPLIVLGIFGVFFFILLFELVYLVVGALLVWLVAAVKKFKTTYWTAYRLSLHLITPWLIVSALFTVLGIRGRVPFLGTVLLVIAAVVNLPAGKPEASEPVLSPKPTLAA